VADEMIEWFEKEACDGFMLMAPTYPESFEKFVYLVIPIFQERVILEATMRVIC
jgi:alkanesulfonate monooxygenase SsuD/methylene tetrahydromethanopterin reductase-like flavin-dependent oxidoreductase (luciferase family)